MKNLLLLVLFIPSLSFAQKFEVSEQAGGAVTGHIESLSGSFSNKVAISYYPIKHLIVSAFYETEWWRSMYNSFGLGVDYITQNEYIGIDVKQVHAGSYNDNQGGTFNYNTSYGYGAHIGTKQKLQKHLYILEEIGYEIVMAKGNYTYPPIGFAGDIKTPFTQQLNYAYVRIGLSYKF